MENNNSKVISISTATFFKALIIFLIIVFLYLIKEVIALIFISLVLASALDPWVDWFQKRKIPRGLAIVVIYLISLALISAAVILIVPPITKEVKQIASNFPVYYDKIFTSLDNFQLKGNPYAQSELQKGLNALSSNLPNALTNLFSTIFSFFGGLVSFFLILVITFYFTVEEEGLKSFLKAICPSKYQPYLAQLIFRIQRKMGSWLRGQLVLSLIIFSMVFIGLSILGVPYALLLALIAGILEIIPFIGPTLAAIPGVFFAFLQSPLLGLLTLGLYLIIQQAENHLILPKVMSKSVGMNPLVVIVVMLVGAKLGGVVGALLAVPVATAGTVFLEDFLERRVNAEDKLAE